MANDWRKLFKAAEAQGFTVQRTRSDHWMVRDPEGRAVATVAGSASDHRAWQNTLSRLKRAGLVWPPPKRRDR